MLQTYKPDSVSSRHKCRDQLSFIWDRNFFPPLSAHPPTHRWYKVREFGRAVLSAGLRGISAPKVYPPIMLPCTAVGSYPTFSPLPQMNRAVIFCGTLCSRLGGTRQLTGGLLFAVRTFLSV